MKICLSGTELDTGESVALLLEQAMIYRMQGVELRYPKNMLLQTPAEIEALVGEHDVPVVCIATGSELYRRGGSEDDQQLLCTAIRLAHRLEAPLVSTYFGYAAWRDDERAIDTYIDYLEPCLELAEELGVTICLENEFDAFGLDPLHSDITRRPLSLLHLLQEVNHPSFRLAFNPAHFYCAGVEPFPYAYQLLRDWIGYIRVRDIRLLQESGPDPDWNSYTDAGNQFHACPLGKGALNWSGLLRQLKDDCYGGFLCLEPGAAPQVREAAWLQATQHLRAQIKALQLP